MDPIANLIVILKNGYLANKDYVMAPYSKFKLEILKVLEKEGRIAKIERKENQIKIDLKYDNNKPAINEIKKVSKSGRRVYIKTKHIKPLKGGRGLYLISTPLGILTDKEASKKKMGGEVICLLW